MVAENLPSRVSGLVKRSLPSYSTPETGHRAWFAPRGSTPVAEQSDDGRAELAPQEWAGGSKLRGPPVRRGEAA